MKRRNPALVDQVRALSATQKSIYQNARHLGVGPREALALAISGRYLRTAKPVRPTPKLHDALARSRYVQQDAREALDAALSLGNMAGVRKYAAQIKAARQAEHDVATALGEVGQRAGGHWTAKRDARAKAWYREDFEASKIIGARAGRAVGRRNPAQDGKHVVRRNHHLRVGDRVQYSDAALRRAYGDMAERQYLTALRGTVTGVDSRGGTFYDVRWDGCTRPTRVGDADVDKVYAPRANPASAGKLAYDAILRAALAAADAAPRERPTGIGRVYVVIDKVHRRGVAAAAKKVGLRYLQKAYGTSDGVLYIGYDNASGRELARGAAIARVLKAAGIGAYRDEVAD